MLRATQNWSKSNTRCWKWNVIRVWFLLIQYHIFEINSSIAWFLCDSTAFLLNLFCSINTKQTLKRHKLSPSWPTRVAELWLSPSWFVADLTGDLKITDRWSQNYGYFHRRRGDIQAIQPFTQTLIYSHEFRSWRINLSKLGQILKKIRRVLRPLRITLLLTVTAILPRIMSYLNYIAA